MIITTTSSIEGRRIVAYKGIACGEVVFGAHLGKDILASFTNLVGGRSESYESSLRETRDGAISEMMEEARRLGANAIVGVKFDYGVVGQQGSMMMVAVSGTAVVLE
ncbi:MAG: heavy metal-binding domain-containing protein [Hyphomonas sp.]|jgi:uncharacterized protein YbjQ (UPF0145 family)|uniref:YbjQ family protein n=1 Tax=Hyphomonas sp. TaxID=87 RepID=UPI0037C071DA|nr:heavy metal-binding domain-containing protein [Hyphomonas sp.]